VLILSALASFGDVHRNPPRRRLSVDDRRVAHRLDEVGEMRGEQIDAILLEG
jgi:hypothetical protein